MVAKTVQFLRGTISQLSGDAGGEIVLMLGGEPANNLYIVFKWSRLLGSRGLANENCAIFFVSSQLTVERFGSKHCTIF